MNTVQIILGAPLIPFGLWIGWRGLRDSTYDGTLLPVLKCVFTMIAGALISAIALAVMIM